MPAIHKGSPKIIFQFVASKRQSVLGGLPAIGALAQQFDLWRKLRQLSLLDPRKRKGSGFGPDAILAQFLYCFAAGGASLADAQRLEVGTEYCQTNDTIVEQQFTALLRHLHRQKWADTNTTAWVGFSLGAEKATRFALNHPQAQPRLLVRLSGGWIPELEGGGPPQHPTANSQHSTFNIESPPSSIQHSATTIAPCQPLSPQTSTHLLLHGDQDTVFPVSDARRVESALRTNGCVVELKVLPGQSHNFDPNRGVVFRRVGEYCLRSLKGPRAFETYQSIATWQARARPLWWVWIPAALWLLAWSYASWRRLRQEGGPVKRALTVWEIGLRWVAGIVAALALAQTAFHFLEPQLANTPRSWAMARRHFVPPKVRVDFDFLAQKPEWLGKRLKALLQHVELANYNRGLVNWQLDDADYRDFVLSPQIDPAFDEDMAWRRVLRESLYPRIRKENAPETAAEVVGRHLQERITVVEGFESPRSIAGIRQRQVTDQRGFETLHIAALRAVGIPARLTSDGQAESFVRMGSGSLCRKPALRAPWVRGAKWVRALTRRGYVGLP
jgi:dienelactone hydrolase